MKRTSDLSFIKSSYIISFIFLVFMMAGISAQQPVTYIASGKDRQKDISGRYGGNSGICLFEDGKFMLYGYATRVFGSYGFEKDYLLFYPDKPDLFEIYATHDPTIKDTRMDFIGFEKGKTFIQFDNDNTQKVFNDEANCFKQSYVHQLSNLPKTINLFAQRETADDDSTYRHQEYKNDKGYNRFILVYNHPRREQEDFSGFMFIVDGKQLGIRLSNYSKGGGFLRENERKQWQDILTTKEQYYRFNNSKPNEIFANPLNNTFEPDLKVYILEKVTNRYISKQLSENEAYLAANPYEDNRYLRKYIKQNIRMQNDDHDKTKKFTTSLFTASCNDSKK